MMTGASRFAVTPTMVQLFPPVAILLSIFARMITPLPKRLVANPTNLCNSSYDDVRKTACESLGFA